MTPRRRSVFLRLVDAQYRLYDRVRHRDAARVTAEPGRTGPFEGLGEGGYLLFGTFKRDGTPVPTPVMFAHRDGKVYLRTEERAMKVKRLRRDPHVRIARCNARGRPKSPVFEGRGRILDGEEAERARRILWESYTPAIKVYEGTADRLPVDLVYVEVEPVPT